MKSIICFTCRHGPSSHTTLLLETGPCLTLSLTTALRHRSQIRLLEIDLMSGEFTPALQKPFKDILKAIYVCLAQETQKDRGGASTYNM